MLKDWSGEVLEVTINNVRIASETDNYSLTFESVNGKDSLSWNNGEY